MLITLATPLNSNFFACMLRLAGRCLYDDSPVLIEIIVMKDDSCGCKVNCEHFMLGGHIVDLLKTALTTD